MSSPRLLDDAGGDPHPRRNELNPMRQVMRKSMPNEWGDKGAPLGATVTTMSWKRMVAHAVAFKAVSAAELAANRAWEPYLEPA